MVAGGKPTVCSLSNRVKVAFLKMKIEMFSGGWKENMVWLSFGYIGRERIGGFGKEYHQNLNLTQYFLVLSQRESVMTGKGKTKSK